MAIVRITKIIRNIITNGINEKFQSQINQVKEAVEKEPNALLMYRCLVSEEQEHMAAKLPKNSVQTSVHMYFSVKHKATDQLRKLELTFAQDRIAPYEWCNQYSSMHLKLTPEVDEVIQPLLDKWSHLESQRNTLVTNINALLDNCATIQQAVQVMPSIIELLDDSTRERYNQVVGGKRKKFDPKELELSEETKILLVKTRLK